MPVTAEEIIRDNFSNHQSIMDAHGFTLEHLLALAKKETKAKTSKTIKVKGAVPDTIRGRRIVATSGVIVRGQDGERDYGDGETVIEWDEIDWGTRQKSRMDLHRLRGDYPPERREISGNLGIGLHNLTDQELDEMIKKLSETTEV